MKVCTRQDCTSQFSVKLGPLLEVDPLDIDKNIMLTLKNTQAMSDVSDVHLLYNGLLSFLT